MEKPTSVFIVDDSQIERTMLADHLSKYPNLEVREFANGEYLLRELITGTVQEPNVVLLDYFLESSPGSAKDGLEVLAKLKEISPSSKVIMLTSVTNEKIKELAKKGGALDYVVKGVHGHQQLDEVLEKHGLVKNVTA